MRILLMVALVLHLLMELMAAAALIGGPEGITNAGAGNMWSMHYGFAALAIASISVWVWPRRSDLGVVTLTLCILLVFHYGLVLSLFLAGDQMGGMIGHAVLAVLFTILFVGRRQACGEAQAG